MLITSGRSYLFLVNFQSESQEHLRMDSKLDIKEHKQNVLNKVNKIIGVLRKLLKTLVKPPLITIY